jgi:hypothetical protein
MRIIHTSLLAATALLGLCVGDAHAQTFVVAKVPFPFMLRGQKFPAGTYQVRDADASSGLVTIQSETSGAATFAFAQHSSGTDPAGDKPALVFDRYENGYRLTEIWESGVEGLTLPSIRHGSKNSEADSNTDTSHETTYVVAEGPAISVGR